MVKTQCQILLQSNIIYFSWKFQFNLFLIYPLELLFLDEQSDRVDPVKIKLILSCRTNYITKRQWCNSNEVVSTVEAAWTSGYNAAGLLAPCSSLALLTASWTCSLQSRVQILFHTWPPTSWDSQLCYVSFELLVHYL